MTTTAIHPAVIITERAHRDACYAAWEAAFDAKCDPTDSGLAAHARALAEKSHEAGRIADETATRFARWEG